MRFPRFRSHPFPSRDAQALAAARLSRPDPRSRHKIGGLAAVFLLACVTGCVPATREGQTRIIFSVWGSIEQMEIERKIVAAFERENPDVQVQLLPLSHGRYAEKLQAMFVGKVAPDALTLQYENYHDWAARGALLDVSAEAAALQREHGEFMPLPAHAFTHRGRFHALPVNLPAIVTYVNLDALADAGVVIPPEGLSWPFIEEVAPRLSRRAGNPDALTDYATLFPENLAPLRGFGVRLFDDDENPQRVLVNSPETVRFLGFMRRLRSAPWNVPALVLADEGRVNLFRKGGAAFFFSGRWETPSLIDRTDFRWDIMPYPAGPAGRITMFVGTGVAVSRDSREPEAARRFVKFYASPAAARISMRGGRTVPVYRSLVYSDEFLSLRPPVSIDVLPPTMEAGAARDLFHGPGGREIRQILARRIEQAQIQPDTPLEAIVALLETDLQRWLEKYQRRHSS